MCGRLKSILPDIAIMIHELLKIIKKAEEMIESQNHQLAVSDKIIEKVYQDLQEINEKLNEAYLKDNTSTKF